MPPVFKQHGAVSHGRQQMAQRTPPTNEHTAPRAGVFSLADDLFDSKAARVPQGATVAETKTTTDVKKARAAFDSKRSSAKEKTLALGVVCSLLAAVGVATACAISCLPCETAPCCLKTGSVAASREPTPPRLGEGLRTSPLLLSDVIAPCPRNFKVPNYLTSRQMALAATASYANPGGKPSPLLQVADSTCAACFSVVVRPFLAAVPVFDELISLTNGCCDMGRCCVPNSRGNYDNGPKVRLFSFPRDVKRRAEWQRAVRRRDVDVGLLKDPKTCLIFAHIEPALQAPERLVSVVVSQDLSVRVYFKYAPLVSDDVCIPGEILDVRVLDNLLDDVERYIEKKAHQQEDKVGRMLGLAYSLLDDICHDE
ncbi:hypothetical protein HPB47_018331 [Ixodes persulcatus]|uniref:Uncharacterized protein n=1 Tax=Ixodes persulcatus TaxID=34615 RepID=A0AC60QL52_IXOPE|nr:hypothetical protein HPB47_018331 [Ixodes persulcatus]